ncbi:uncharacterized protein LOC120671134 isoform X1 [Panicum virgatum]|uniref:uncharacterized protein LOC120671134 isoform X1 n=1 Tax=Panicum virgatum TaxID=38727 RepID=UPI0019D6086B|nr:uncharacterized protein LOC120671134 isoform X1 [Panicum virgatum]
MSSRTRHRIILLTIVMHHWPLNQHHLKERVKLHLRAQSQLKERQLRATDFIIVKELVHHLFRLVKREEWCRLGSRSLKLKPLLMGMHLLSLRQVQVVPPRLQEQPSTAKIKSSSTSRGRPNKS